ncbi:MAG: polysaccharide deacetylase family protein [Planctomycetaceae bacterium]|nr:polysaccharide deacetylase family protein [Planctomycetaceae bacterium]MCA9043376.1 polysaccharide deacetylase family protein [Planctomycetaceae bacterium]MCB9952041.1 polysaccharide deacetylase family protein [Planctomycetaceae bacterium]
MSGLVSLTFDDALDQHLDVGVRLLNEAKLPGTFYAHLNAPALSRRLDEWRSAAAIGHELGNHTVFHPAVEAKGWVQSGNALERYDLSRIRMELETANDWLTAIDGCSKRSFAFPCSNRIVGHFGWPVRLLRRIGLQRTRFPGMVERYGLDFGSTRDDYLPVVQSIFPAARVGGLAMDDTPPPLTDWNRWLLKSAAVEGHSFEQMRGFVERGLNAGSWSILQFHGIGGGHSMDCDVQEFQKLVYWLRDTHADRVTTIHNGAQAVWEATA